MNQAPLCPLCAERATTRFFEACDYITGQFFPLWHCARCDFAFVWPQPLAMEIFYPRFYRRYNSLIVALLQHVQSHRAKQWIRRFGPSQQILEIGCGDGWMLAALRELGWKPIGIERTIESARFAATKQELPMFVGDLAALQDSSFDIILLHQSLEHLTDPVATLAECRRLLRPNGHLIVAVPNMASWQFRVGRRHWLHLDVPRHLNQFTPSSLQKAMNRTGLGVEQIYCSP